MPEPRFPRGWWPGAACEHVAIAVAGVLADRSFADGWTLVYAKRPGELSGHTWLELRGETGDVQYSIDPTLHQFGEWDEPFIGPGTTPARDVFTEVHWSGEPFLWPYLGKPRDVFLDNLRLVREWLAEEDVERRVEQ